MAFTIPKLFRKNSLSKEERLALISANKDVRIAEAPYRSKVIVARTFFVIAVSSILLVAFGIIDISQFLSIAGHNGIASWLTNVIKLKK